MFSIGNNMIPISSFAFMDPSVLLAILSRFSAYEHTSQFNGQYTLSGRKLAILFHSSSLASTERDIYGASCTHGELFGSMRRPQMLLHLSGKENWFDEKMNRTCHPWLPLHCPT
jgi:hypothetical protein